MRSVSPEAVQVYKELSEVERAFRQLKDVIEMRPIYHQTDRRVQAHLFVAALAFLVDRALEKKLKSAGLDLSSQKPGRSCVRLGWWRSIWAGASASARLPEEVAGPHRS